MKNDVGVERKVWGTLEVEAENEEEAVEFSLEYERLKKAGWDEEPEVGFVLEVGENE